MHSDRYQIAVLSATLGPREIEELCESLQLPRCDFYGYSRLGQSDGRFANHRGLSDFSRDVDLAIVIELSTFADLVRKQASRLKLPVCCADLLGRGRFASAAANAEVVRSWFAEAGESGAKAVLPLVILAAIDRRNDAE